MKKVIKLDDYKLNTWMGKLSPQSMDRLSFLSQSELDTFNSIGYRGKSRDGKFSDRTAFLNSLGKGTFNVVESPSETANLVSEIIILRAYHVNK